LRFAASPKTKIRYRAWVLTGAVRHRIDGVLAASQELDLLQRVPHTCPISAHHEWNFDELLDMAWKYLDLVRMYEPRYWPLDSSSSSC